ncbi:hypothetical protein QFZ35_001889 [Arthrobacter ulcerisalmonis]|nr:hypothetical protein [Arthrobacter ulcerisalmonis]
MKTKQELHAESTAGGDHQHDNLVSAVMVRFFDNVQGDWESGCWNWTAGVDRDGYPQFWSGKNVRGHRWVYAAFFGTIPGGLDVDHLCFNPRCVAPYHLEAVTHKENQRRKAFRRAEAGAGRPIRIQASGTTVWEFTVAAVLGLPLGGVIVLPARLGACTVRSTSQAPYGTLPMPLRLRPGSRFSQEHGTEENLVNGRH